MGENAGTASRGEEACAAISVMSWIGSIAAYLCFKAN